MSLTGLARNDHGLEDDSGISLKYKPDEDGTIFRGLKKGTMGRNIVVDREYGI